ncbi:MAG: DNA-formamidopyrimidine glycosylase [Parcubacteria group bacterium]|nr:DNA-formamidopyrimidine glycosylase [Parcubacteria group bacterium]MCR4342777.1 DNA-formamidopyrimidine glycosylase [Patescibacteria group bacterium]
MPELPEVQTTVSGLNEFLPGLKIRGVWSDWKKMIKFPKSFSSFKKELIGHKIIKVERRGKNILIYLSDDKTLLIHMKMTGSLFYGDGLGVKFNHLVLNLSNGKQLTLSDLRKFAKVLIWPTSRLADLSDINKIGRDALEKDLSLKKFKDILKKRPNGKIKQILMDQDIVAGIGNIYSDEILWYSGIHPLRKISSIKENEFKKIYKNMRLVLKKAIKLGGDSMSDYRNIYGEKGHYQDHHKVYHREGEPCLKRGCRGIIKRIKIGGRSACFCPVCQK